MQQFRRTLAALVVAATLPTIVLSAVQVTLALSDERRETERVMIDRARRISLIVDAEIQSDVTGLRALATAQALAEGRVATFKDRARAALTLEPSWRVIHISDARSGETLASVAADADAAVTALNAPPPTVDPRRANPALSDDGRLLFVSVAAPATSGAAPKFVVTLGKDAAVFQRTLVANAAPGELAALVTPDGRFLARTINYEQRRGQFATMHLRNAVAAAGSGVYRGVTLEGMRNYTAFWASPATRISAHIATPSWSLDQTRVGSALIAVGAAFAALAIAVALSWLVLRELAERRAIDTALAQAQKMEAVGRMAGGIAHDFANIVAAFGAGLRLLAREPGLSERSKTVLAELDGAVERALSLSRRLLDFARVQDVAVERVEIPAALKTIEDLIRHTVGPAIDVRYQIDPAVGAALTNAHAFDMAILNLAANARDAMPDGGQLTISAEPAATKRAMIDVSVADTGQGMSEDVRSRALEPFFTTKPAGQGTGLGLAQVVSLARRSKGDVEIDSAPGRGSRITLRLPRAP